MALRRLGACEEYGLCLLDITRRRFICTLVAGFAAVDDS